jgi:acetyl esterase/lipase
MKTFSILVFTFSFILCSGQQYSKKWSDINYADDEMGYHLLDIYLPKITKQTYPVVIYIYGSGWFGNDLKGKAMNTLGSALLDAGYAVVTPNHRSSLDTVYPAQIHDIKATIRFVRANCGEYQLDTSFVGIMGSSSGGHMASIIGTTNNIWQYTIDSLTMGIEGNLGNYDNVSSEVDAVCDWFGGSDFLLNMDSSCGSSFDKSAASSLIGGPVQDNPIKCALANPITYVDPTDPPFLIIHGDADKEVSYCESEALFNALQLAGVKSEFILVPGGSHGEGLYTINNMSKMVDFFDDISGNYVINIDKIQNNRLTIFPNPTSSKINIKASSDNVIKQYELYDSSGKIISKENIESTQINVSYLDKGLYFIRLITENGNTFMANFVKK